MIKERADELVAALRSRKYKQGRFNLRYQDDFCCLGVACDISGLGEWQVWGSDMIVYNPGSDDQQFDDQQSGHLPNPVREYFGFSSATGYLDEHTSLSEMNDDGKTFFEIADFIEQNWEQL